MTIIKKLCCSCCVLKPIEEFYRIRKDSNIRASRCKECSAKAFQEWYSKPENRKRNIAMAYAWAQDPKNKEKRKAAYTKWNRKRKKK